MGSVSWKPRLEGVWAAPAGRAFRLEGAVRAGRGEGLRGGQADVFMSEKVVEFVASVANVLPLAWLRSPPQGGPGGRVDMPSPQAAAVSKPKPCQNTELPEQFVAINPEFLKDRDKWTYRDLQVRPLVACALRMHL